MIESTTGNEVDPGGVDHPIHYNTHPSGVECIDLIENLGFNLGSAVKYVFRRGDKGNVRKDLDKAEWYLRREARRVKDRGEFGSPGAVWRWDKVISLDESPAARAFYLAAVRGHLDSALTALAGLLEEERANGILDE